MHQLVSFNNRILSAAEASISVVSSAALYGKGVFTTIAVYDGKPFLWKKHWRRLRASSVNLNIDLSDFSEEDTKAALVKLLLQNGVRNGRARITFFDESSSSIWPFESGRKTSLLITSAEAREIPENLRLTISPCLINSTSPLAGIKSCNYLEKILALDEARNRGFDEAVYLNERGEIASACMANLFWLTDGKLFTPSLKTGCLAGTTREYVLENLESLEIVRGIDALKNADSIFLTSAGIGVVQVAEFDGVAFNTRPHEILELLPR